MSEAEKPEKPEVDPMRVLFNVLSGSAHLKGDITFDQFKRTVERANLAIVLNNGADLRAESLEHYLNS